MDFALRRTATDQDFDDEAQRTYRLGQGGPSTRHRLPPSIVAKNEAHQANRPPQERRHTTTAISNPYQHYIVSEQERHDGTDSQSVLGMAIDATELSPSAASEASRRRHIEYTKTHTRQTRRSIWAGFRNVFNHGESIGGDSSCHQEVLRDQLEGNNSKRKASRRLTETLSGYKRHIKRRVSAAFSKRKDSFVPVEHGVAEMNVTPTKGAELELRRRQASIARRAANHPYPSARALYAEEEAMQPASISLSAHWSMMSEMQTSRSRRSSCQSMGQLTESRVEAIMTGMAPLSRQRAKSPKEVHKIWRLMRSKMPAENSITPPNVRMVATDPELVAHMETLTQAVKSAQSSGAFDEEAISKRYAECPGAVTSPAKQSEVCRLWREAHRARALRKVPSSRSAPYADNRPQPKDRRRVVARAVTAATPTTESMTREERYPFRRLDSLVVSTREACEAWSHIHSMP